MIVELPFLPLVSPPLVLGLRSLHPSVDALEFALWGFKGKVFRCWSDDSPVARPALPPPNNASGNIQLRKILSICESAHYQGFLVPKDGCTIAASSRSGLILWRVFIYWISAPYRSGWLFAWGLDDRQHEVIERLRSVNFDLTRFDYYFGAHQRHWGWHVSRDFALGFQ